MLSDVILFFVFGADAMLVIQLGPSVYVHTIVNTNRQLGLVAPNLGL